MANFQTLYSFTGGSDGAYPHAGLTLVGSTLYGTASGNGAIPYGTVFEITGVPEPSGVALAALGLIGLVAWRWRRRKRPGAT